MAESVPFEKGECSGNRNANMAESDSSEIQIQEQPHQTPNSPVAAVKEERKNPELVRAIVNGDLIGFKEILEKKESNDIESNDRVSLRGFTCGENTALHVVAGVMEKSSSTDTLLDTLLEKSSSPIAAEFAVRVLLPLISLLEEPQRQTLFFGFSIEEIVKHMWRTRNAQSREKEGHELIEDAYDSDIHKMIAYVEIAKIIYCQDPDLLNACNNATETPLHCAAKAGNLQMVSLLIDFADVEGKEGPQKLKKVLWARNEVGETALHGAARSGYTDIVKALLIADDYLTRELGKCPVAVAVEESLCADENLASSSTEKEKEKEKEINLASIEDFEGISALYLAVAAGFLDVVQQLIAPNRNPSYAGPDEQTALHAAVLTQKENIMREILEWKPDIAAKADTAQNTPLHYATLIGNTYAVQQLLLKDTGPVYTRNSSGSFPVHLAAEAGNSKVIKELLRTCPDVGELLDNEKRNFLHIAVEKKKIRVITLAHKEGINANVINAKDKDGNTPLHLAVINSESEIFVFLCQNKRVNPHIRNKEGLTPLDLSASLKDHQFTYTLNPQSIIHRSLVTRGAFQKSLST